MASRVCWYCDTKSHMTMHGEPVELIQDWWQGAYRCDECSRLSIATAALDGYSGQSLRNLSDWLAAAASDIDWMPLNGITRDFPDVPEHIASAASEAYVCLSVGAYRGTGALARAVVEATAKEKGITTGLISQKIDALHAQGVVREHVKEAAHEIRHFGNDMAHGDFTDPVTREEAEEIAQLMSEVLDEVFQSPARVAKRQAARLAKKS